MNKTYYKISRNQKRLIQTQCNFRSHTPQSPAYRKAPVDDSCVKSDQLKIETSLSKHYRNAQLKQRSPLLIGVFTTLRQGNT